MPYIDLIFEGVDDNIRTHLSLINDMFVSFYCNISNQSL